MSRRRLALRPGVLTRHALSRGALGPGVLRRAALSLAGVGLVACGGGGSGQVVLDGRPRYPSGSGVVTSVDLPRRVIVVDGRRYRVSSDLQSFATMTLQPLPLNGRVNQFVEFGLRGQTVVWLASFSVVAHPPGGPPTAYYVGVFERLDSRHRAVFQDGTVLPLVASIAPPAAGTRVVAQIDPSQKIARSLSPD
jgi:hypothetical protein